MFFYEEKKHPGVGFELRAAYLKGEQLLVTLKIATDGTVLNPWRYSKFGRHFKFICLSSLGLP